MYSLVFTIFRFNFFFSPFLDQGKFGGDWFSVSLSSLKNARIGKLKLKFETKFDEINYITRILIKRSEERKKTNSQLQKIL